MLVLMFVCMLMRTVQWRIERRAISSHVQILRILEGIRNI